MSIIVEILKHFGPGHVHRTGVRVFEQVVLRRDLERWVGRGGKVDSGGAPKRAAIMYPAQSLPSNWLHPQVMYMRVVTEQGFPQRRPPTYFAQQISDAWLGPDIQRMRLDSQTFHGVPGGPSIQVVGTEQDIGVDANTSTTADLTLADVEEYTRLGRYKSACFCTKLKLYVQMLPTVPPVPRRATLEAPLARGRVFDIYPPFLIQQRHALALVFPPRF
ncbi:hypothetical protein BDV93DRAFT_554422 [Ceratobasidium sp. AG-I]|nr:hypothetical protein BDV93DRAFT_554422 [Ceratobasidium sp. AG-I]